MIIYLDTSTVLRVLLRQPGALTAWGNWEVAYSSELMGVEARRAIDRLRLAGRLDDQGVAANHEALAAIEGGLALVAVTRLVLRRAALPFPTTAKTLDALHLATAMLLREQRHDGISFATHDEQQGTAARALGLPCIGL